MWDKLSEPVGEALGKRLRDPVALSFAISWVAFHWEAFYVTFLIFDVKRMPAIDLVRYRDKISYIKALRYGWDENLLWPTLIAIAVPIFLYGFGEVVGVCTKGLKHLSTKAHHSFYDLQVVPQSELKAAQDRLEQIRTEADSANNRARKATESRDNELAKIAELEEALKSLREELNQAHAQLAENPGPALQEYRDKLTTAELDKEGLQKRLEALQATQAHITNHIAYTSINLNALIKEAESGPLSVDRISALKFEVDKLGEAISIANPSGAQRVNSVFVLKRSPNAQFFFELLAGNSEVILTSEVYASKESATQCIAAMKSNAPFDERYVKRATVNNELYFVLRAANHEVLGTSGNYSSDAAREGAIEAVKRGAPIAEVRDGT